MVHEPVESKGKTEEELAKAVRESIIAGLPEEQRPPPDNIEVAEETVKSTAEVVVANEAASEPPIIAVVPEEKLPLPSS